MQRGGSLAAMARGRRRVLLPAAVAGEWGSSRKTGRCLSKSSISLASAGATKIKARMRLSEVLPSRTQAGILP